jgi:hypothetical protein
MRLPRVRLSVRRMMVAVAVVAVAAEVEVWRRRYPYCRTQAARCASAHRAHLRLAQSHERIAALYSKPPTDPRAAARYSVEQSVFFIKAAWSERAKAKRASERAAAFRQAAMCPWLSVPPGGNDPLEASPRPP